MYTLCTCTFTSVLYTHYVDLLYMYIYKCTVHSLHVCRLYEHSFIISCTCTYVMYMYMFICHVHVHMSCTCTCSVYNVYMYTEYVYMYTMYTCTYIHTCGTICRYMYLHIHIHKCCFS